MAKPDKPVKLADLELTVVAPALMPMEHSGKFKKTHGPLLHLTCLVCGDMADSRDHKLLVRAANVHARTVHNANAQVQPEEDDR